MIKCWEGFQRSWQMTKRIAKGEAHKTMFEFGGQNFKQGQKAPKCMMRDMSFLHLSDFWVPFAED